MKRLLLLLLISPLTFAEVYDFVCDVKGENRKAVIIVDTDERYIKLGGLKFQVNYTDDGTIISAKINNDEPTVITFNKLTGEASHVNLEMDGYWFEYICKPAVPLIP